MDLHIDLTQFSEDQLRHLAVQMLATLDKQGAALNEKDVALHERDETIRQYRIATST